MISSFYQSKLSNINVDRSSGHPKPHKVCLLFAIMDLIKNGQVIKNEFIINDELKAAFSFHFERLRKANDADKIIQPFYHLQNDGIWHFKIKAGKQDAYDIVKANGSTPSIKALFEVIDYAYLDDELFKYFQSELSRSAAKEVLLENLEDLSVQYHRWLRAMGKSERTANSYVGAIKGTISTWASDANISHQNLIAIQSYSTINKIAERLTNYEVFITKNTKGNQMYSAALNSYKNFLSVTCQTEVAEDIEHLQKIHKRVPVLVNALIESGDRTQNITRIITSFTDAITYRIISLAIGTPFHSLHLPSTAS